MWVWKDRAESFRQRDIIILVEIMSCISCVGKLRGGGGGCEISVPGAYCTQSSLSVSPNCRKENKAVSAVWIWKDRAESFR